MNAGEGTCDRGPMGMAAFQPHHLLSIPSEKTFTLLTWETERMLPGHLLPTALGDLPERVMGMKAI